MEYVYVLTVYEITYNYVLMSNDEYGEMSADAYIHKTYEGAKQHAYDMGLKITQFPVDDQEASIEKKKIRE